MNTGVWKKSLGTPDARRGRMVEDGYLRPAQRQVCDGRMQGPGPQGLKACLSHVFVWWP